MPDPRRASLMLVLCGAFAATGSDAPAISPTSDLPADLTPEQTRIMRTIPVEFQESIALAETFGRIIYAHDRAAWLATDLVGMRALGKLKGGEGWLITDLGEAQFRVTWFGQVDGERRALLDIDVDVAAWKELPDTERKHKKGRPLTEEEHALARAQRDAIGREWLRCSSGYNTVSFPFTDRDRRMIYVYLLAGDTNDAPVHLGGDHRFRYEADGTTLIDSFSNTNSCINQQLPKNKAKGEALMVSHLKSPAPTEFHFFRMLNYRLPIYVMTVDNRIIWIAESTGFRIIDDGKDDQPGKE
jgi:hypothetical protein